jgi:beta-glucosidase
MILSTVSVLLLSELAATKNGTQSASASVSIIPTPTSSTSVSGTAVTNPTAFSTNIELNLDEYWDLFIGPVSTATVNTTVSATPVPTNELIPPPGLHHSSFPTGKQIALVLKNESWSFPKGFWWGVASAAYQVEGAVKAEGRGPSIWDALLHRVTGYSVANQTGDIADNQYFLYKQGMKQSISFKIGELIRTRHCSNCGLGSKNVLVFNQLVTCIPVWSWPSQ